MGEVVYNVDILPPATAAGKTGNNYKIQKGDTLTKIARKTGISINELVKLNQGTRAMRNKDMIFAGQTLRLRGDDQIQNDFERDLDHLASLKDVKNTNEFDAYYQGMAEKYGKDPKKMEQLIQVFRQSAAPKETIDTGLMSPRVQGVTVEPVQKPGDKISLKNGGQINYINHF